MKNRCINVTIGVSDYDDDELSQVFVFMMQQQYKTRLSFVYGPHPHYPIMQNNYAHHLGLWYSLSTVLLEDETCLKHSRKQVGTKQNFSVILLDFFVHPDKCSYNVKRYLNNRIALGMLI